MAESSGNLIEIPAPNRLEITTWKVRKGSKVSQGAVLGLYKLINPEDPENQEKIKHEHKEDEEEINTTTQSTPNNNQLQKLKSSHVGTVSEILAKEGQEINEGSIVLQIRGCSHPTVMKDMCADCGADLRTEMGVSGCRKENVSATVAMVHSIPELIVSEEQALELGRLDEIRLKKTRKLVLLVDLDQTLIHTTNDNIPPNLKGIHHFQLWQGMNLLWYHTRIRPHTQQFLENISKLYELHICTFGVRMYAHTIARFIDPAGKFFSHRILSRDECFNALSKTANLKSLFPCGDSMVCIIDDREDVWNFAPNLIHVKPYRFFQGTADINAPTGFSKKENDTKPLTHQVRKVPGNSNTTEKGKGTSAGNKDKNKTSKNAEKGKKLPEEEEVKKLPKEENKLPEKEEENKLSEKEEEKKLPEKEEEKKLPEEEEGKKLPEEAEEGKKLPEEEGKKTPEELTLEKCKLAEEEKVDSVSKDEDHSAASKEQDINVNDKDNADDSGNQTSKTDAEDSNKGKTPDTVESKLDEETKMDVESKSSDDDNEEDDDESKSEDSEGLSEDSSVSGMSLCGNSSTNATSNKDDSNVDENDDNDNDNEDKMIEWEDEDDYLFYLEEILQRAHKAYFDISDQLNAEGKSSKIKLDLKAIIPYVKRKVLKGCNICFSGVIPLNTPIVKSRAYNVATCLGANVHETFIPYSSTRKSNYTTHLIANKMGTSKVHAAKRARKVSIVSLNWLWSCAERWDHVEENLFPLLKEKGPLDSDNGGSSPEVTKELKSASRKRKPSDGQDDDVFTPIGKQRKIEDSDSSEELSEDEVIDDQGKEVSKNNNNDDGKKARRTGSHYNPLYSFSDEERANMDKELEELMDEDDSDSDEKEAEDQLRKQILRDRKCDTSSEDSLSGEFPHGWNNQKLAKRRSGKKKVSIKRDESISEDSEASISEKYEKTIEVFAAQESDSSNDDSDGESIGSIDEEIAEAVEKEFLAR